MSELPKTEGRGHTNVENDVHDIDFDIIFSYHDCNSNNVSLSSVIGVYFPFLINETIDSIVIERDGGEKDRGLGDKDQRCQVNIAELKTWLNSEGCRFRQKPL